MYFFFPLVAHDLIDLFPFNLHQREGFKIVFIRPSLIDLRFHFTDDLETWYQIKITS